MDQISILDILPWYGVPGTVAVGTAVQMYFLVQKIALFGLLGTKKFKILA